MCGWLVHSALGQTMRYTSGLTLIELVVVLAILAAVSGVLVPLFSGTMENANQVATKQSLVRVRDAMQRYWTDTKHVTLDGVVSVATDGDRFNMDWLFSNPVTGDDTNDFSINSKIGWRGPYLLSSTGDAVVAGAPFLIDAWNGTILTQQVPSVPGDVRIVSPGPDGVLSLPPTTATDSLTATEIGDDLYVALRLR